MNAQSLPAVALLVLAALAVTFGGAEGAGLIALAAVFLAAFALLLVRRSTIDPRALRNRRAEETAHFLRVLMLLGIAARMGIALAIRGTGANEAIAPDEATFHDNALWFAAWLRDEVPQPFAYKWQNHSQVGYFALVGSLYGLFGEFPVVPVLLNCLVGGLCAQPAYLLAARVAGRRAGMAAAVLVTFFPSLVLWSTLLIRDAWVIFLLLWCSCLAQSLLARFRLRTFAWLVLCLAAMATLRSYMLVLMTAAILLAYLVAAVRRPGRAIATALACGVSVVVLMRVSGLGTDYLGDAPLASLALQRQYNSMTGEGAIALDGYDLSTPTGALTYLPIGLAWFLLSPFPWQFSGRQGLAIPEVLLWYACLPLVVAGIAFALRRRRRHALVPLATGLLLTVLYSLLEGNVGIIFRHRAQALALLLPFAAVGWARRRSRARREERRASETAKRLVAPRARGALSA